MENKALNVNSLMESFQYFDILKATIGLPSGPNMNQEINGERIFWKTFLEFKGLWVTCDKCYTEIALKLVNENPNKEIMVFIKGLIEYWQKSKATRFKSDGFDPNVEVHIEYLRLTKRIDRVMTKWEKLYNSKQKGEVKK